MYPVTPTYLAALRQSHTAVMQVDAYRAAVLIASDLPIVGGDVTVDVGSATRRVLNLTLAKQVGLFDLLAPTGTELRPKRGIRYPSGAIEWVPLGRFGVDSQRMGYAPSGNLALTAPDRWADVVRAKFETPMLSVPGATVAAEMSRLALGGAPGATVINTATSTSVLRSCVWQQDRAQAIIDMGKAIGAETFFDVDGNIIIRDIPTLTTGSSVWLIDASTTGVLLSADRERNRQKTFNVVVVTSSATDGAAPFAPVVVADNDPTSPTWVGGAFGRVPYFLSSPSFANTGQATAAGLAMLETQRGLAAQLSVENIVNAALDGRDVIDVLLPRERADVLLAVERHIIDRVVIPLTIDGSQAIATRSSRPDDT